MIKSAMTLNVGDKITETLSNDGEIKNFYSFGGYINEHTISIVLTCTLVNYGNIFSESYYFSIEPNIKYKLPKAHISFDVMFHNHKSNVVTMGLWEK
ncbi:hypothetical protein MT997_28625 [Paenibacillus sp. OVF10]|nr:hypothetical protein MT997_28625 [Paenibacillus sp. OVF10]